MTLPCGRKQGCGSYFVSMAHSEPPDVRQRSPAHFAEVACSHADACVQGVIWPQNHEEKTASRRDESLQTDSAEGFPSVPAVGALRR